MGNGNSRRVFRSSRNKSFETKTAVDVPIDEIYVWRSAAAAEEHGNRSPSRLKELLVDHPVNPVIRGDPMQRTGSERGSRLRTPGIKFIGVDEGTEFIGAF